MTIVALAGGVGAAKLLRGLVRTHPPEDLAVIVNTGDDIDMHGLPVSPDLDTIMYTLAGLANSEQGWGRRDETWNCTEGLAAYGQETWFRLGDRDLATHVLRHMLRNDGLGLAAITAQLCNRLGVVTRLLPMTDDPVANRIVVRGAGGEEDIHFQEYLIKRMCRDNAVRSYVRGLESAQPLPEALDALDALAEADGIVFCPSNPIVSIGPILGFPAYRSAIENRRARAVGVSPIVAGSAVRGPAEDLMTAAGLPVSCVGVAQAYAGLLDTLVIDEVDAALAGDAAAAGSCRVVTAPTIMHGIEESTNLARVVLEQLDPR